MFGSKKSDEEKAAAKVRRDLNVAALRVGNVRVTGDGQYFQTPGQGNVPVDGAKVTLDKGEAAKRITATRVALAGPFALLLRKDTTKLFVTIEGADGSAMLIAVPAGREVAARTFEVMVNSKLN
jgi:hypothetical protein